VYHSFCSNTDTASVKRISNDLFGRIALFIVLMTFMLSVQAQTQLEEVFKTPPASARPASWWHWMNGNITKRGIQNDLQALKQIGIGEVFLFNVGIGEEGPVDFMTDPWLGMFDKTLATCKEEGLRLGLHNCDGFSQNGGPWITLETSMKKFTWSTIDVSGGSKVQQKLPEPDSHKGFYRDVAVVAFKLPKGGRFNLVGSQMRMDGGTKALIDGNLNTKERVRSVSFSFTEPKTLQTIRFQGLFKGTNEQLNPIKIEASDDGQHYYGIGEATLSFREAKMATFGVKKTRAKHFRIVFSKETELAELELIEAARIHFAESKSVRSKTFGHGMDHILYKAFPDSAREDVLSEEWVIDPAYVLNLSDKMDKEGNFTWQAPQNGKWRIIRFGYTSNGKWVSPGTKAGAGLECDKLDSEVVRFHLNQYVGKLCERAGTELGKTLAAMTTDSWECRIQNWTEGLETRFLDKKGYSLIPWLPTLVEGQIIGSRKRTERMLWDWRRFIADQLTQNYFSEVHRFTKEKGLTYASEPTGRQQLLYNISNQRHNDIPMGEFWIGEKPTFGVRVDNKVAASMAHITGRKVVSAESYTSLIDYAISPRDIKLMGDEAFCAGLNHYTFHISAHQAYELFGPGIVFMGCGLHLNRHNTWFGSAKSWIDYISRCSGMLQQGDFVADILAFVGEDVPHYLGWRDSFNPKIPSGYDYDGCDLQGLMEASVENGQIVLPSGMRYSVLLLPDGVLYMRLVVLEKIHQLVEAGAVVVGSRPLGSPSMVDIGEGDVRHRQLVEELWGKSNGEKINHKFGKGRIFNAYSFEEIFAHLSVPADFSYKGIKEPLLYIHRRDAEKEIYFVSNQSEQAIQADVSFRAGPKQPELWNPETGEIVRPMISGIDGDIVTIPLRLEGTGSIFVIFQTPLKDPVVSNNSSEPLFVDQNGKPFKKVTTQKVSVPGPWQAQFDDVPNSPGQQNFKTLTSWSESDKEKLKYFSGEALYRNTLNVSKNLLKPNGELWLDLGEVNALATVRLNGHELPTLWKSPYRVRIDDIVNAGKNELEIVVVNSWNNRLYGDQKLGLNNTRETRSAPLMPEERYHEWMLQGAPIPDNSIAFTSFTDKIESLLPAGLMGPVMIEKIEIEKKNK